MESENKHIIYTWEDIQKYLSGKLGPAEMHAMEKAALDDAFLAEAMEGYEGMQDKDWESRLISLKGNFVKGQTAKVISMKPAARYYMWKVAVAVLIICSGVAITYTLTNKDANQNKSITAINKKEDSVNNIVNQSPCFYCFAKLRKVIFAHFNVGHVNGCSIFPGSGVRISQIVFHTTGYGCWVF